VHLSRFNLDGAATVIPSSEDDATAGVVDMAVASCSGAVEASCCCR